VQYALQRLPARLVRRAVARAGLVEALDLLVVREAATMVARKN
jgi:hypothetical protein